MKLKKNNKTRLIKSKTNAYLCYRYCAFVTITLAIVKMQMVALFALYGSPVARNRCRHNRKTTTPKDDGQTKLGERFCMLQKR